MADSAAAAAAAPMTVDFLRARLLSERSVSRASKERADQLAARVAELEEQVRAVTAQRRQAEQEASEVLALLESQGFCGTLSDDALDDSGSEVNDGDEEKDAGARVTDGDAECSHGEEEREQGPEPAAAKEEPELSETTPQPAGGLSWKGRSASPRKARELRQRHRRSYAYFLASQDPSPKYRMGQSCRKNKRKELSSGRSAASEKGGDGVAELGAEGGWAGLDGEVGGGDRSSGDGGGQYVIRCEKDGEMERVLEKQAELIGQYQAEEKAQTDWEKKFNDNRSSPKGDIVQQKPNVRTLSIAEPPEDASEEYAARRRREAGEHHGQGRARTTAVSAQGSSNNSTNQDQQGDANSDGCSSHNANSASSRQLAIRPPSESSPSSDTLVSKVSDWSSSRFQDHADDQLDSRQPSSTSDIDVESVLQALQRARISLQQKLGRPLPPNQVTLALPAPGDEHRTEEEDLYDDGGDSHRGEPGGSSPSRQEMLALPAPEDYHSCHESACLSLSVDGADTSSLTEKASSSSPHRQEILALPAPGDDRLPGGERDGDMKIPVSSPGLFRLPTDSFPEDEVLSRSNGSDLVELRMRETARARHDACSRDDDVDAGVSAKRFYDPHGSAPASGGRCNVPPSSGFMVGGVSFRSGIPGLPEELRRGGSSLVDADLFMQRACDYTVTNKWML